jgi:hypothetical protein
VLWLPAPFCAVVPTPLVGIGSDEDMATGDVPREDTDTDTVAAGGGGGGACASADPLGIWVGEPFCEEPLVALSTLDSLIMGKPNCACKTAGGGGGGGGDGDGVT